MCSVGGRVELIGTRGGGLDTVLVVLCANCLCKHAVSCSQCTASGAGLCANTAEVTQDSRLAAQVQVLNETLCELESCARIRAEELCSRFRWAGVRVLWPAGGGGDCIGVQNARVPLKAPTFTRMFLAHVLKQPSTCVQSVVDAVELSLGAPAPARSSLFVLLDEMHRCMTVLCDAALKRNQEVVRSDRAAGGPEVCVAIDARYSHQQEARELTVLALELNRNLIIGRMHLQREHVGIDPSESRPFVGSAMHMEAHATLQLLRQLYADGVPIDHIVHDGDTTVHDKLPFVIDGADAPSHHDAPHLIKNAIRAVGAASTAVPAQVARAERDALEARISSVEVRRDAAIESGLHRTEDGGLHVKALSDELVRLRKEVKAVKPVPARGIKFDAGHRCEKLLKTIAVYATHIRKMAGALPYKRSLFINGVLQMVAHECGNHDACTAESPCRTEASREDTVTGPMKYFLCETIGKYVLPHAAGYVLGTTSKVESIFSAVASTASKHKNHDRHYGFRADVAIANQMFQPGWEAAFVNALLHTGTGGFHVPADFWDRLQRPEQRTADSASERRHRVATACNLPGAKGFKSRRARNGTLHASPGSGRLIVLGEQAVRAVQLSAIGWMPRRWMPRQATPSAVWQLQVH